MRVTRILVSCDDPRVLSSVHARIEQRDKIFFQIFCIEFSNWSSKQSIIELSIVKIEISSKDRGLRWKSHALWRFRRWRRGKNHGCILFGISVFYSTTDTIHECGIYGRIFSWRGGGPGERLGWKFLTSPATGIFRLNWRWILSREYFLHWLTSISTGTYLYARKDCELFRSLLDASSTATPFLLLCGLCFPRNFPPIAKIFSCLGERSASWKKERKS